MSLQTVPVRYIKYAYQPVHAFFFGVALSYSVQNGKYWHFPLVLLNPVAYVGYHTYKNRDVVASWVNNQLR